MSNQSLVTQKRSVRDLLALETTRQEIAKVLPKHLTPERMTRVTLTATLRNPALLQCDPASLLSALMVCSQAGLEPDGRLAHLIPFGKQVQVIFDYKGLVTLALRNGAQAVYADKVCENDFFETVVENGDKRIAHKVDWKRPRGPAYAYYAVCKREGVTDYEVMTLDEVQAIRERSRAKDNGPWVTDPDEMGKKTVLRRMSKRWDLLPEIRDVIYADDDTPEVISRPFAKPVFESQKQLVEPENGNGNAEPAPEPEPPAPKPIPAPALKPTAKPIDQPKPKPEPEPPSIASVLRGLCRKDKIPEMTLIGFLVEIGSVEPAPQSLEEIVLQEKGANILNMVREQWADIVQRIQSVTGKGPQ